MCYLFVKQAKKIAKLQFIRYFFVIFAKSFGKKLGTFQKFTNDLTVRKGYENLSRAYMASEFRNKII